MQKKPASSKPNKKSIFANLEGVPLYGKILIFLPLVFILNGGLVGGLCGGLAMWINLKYWKKNISTATKIGISIVSLIGAGVLAVTLASLILGALKQ